MSYDRTDKLFIAGILTVMALVFAGIGYAVWFHATHACSRSHRAWVGESCEMKDYGGDPPIYVPECSPAHWETVCDEYRRR